METLHPKLRFPEFNEDWRLEKIKELFEFKNGLNKEKEYFGKGTPIVNFKDVFNNRILSKHNISGCVEVNEKEKSNYSAKRGDVFFTRTSETIDQIGMSGTLINDIPDCVFSGFVLRARPKTDKLNEFFTAYCFSINTIREKIIKHSSFTTRALTSGTLLNNVEFYYPASLREQTKIANFLSSIDEKINLLKEKKALLEEYKKGVMQKIFNQEIRFKDNNGNDFDDWKNKTLGECLSFEQPTKYLVDSTEYNDDYETPVLTAGKTFILGYTNEVNGIFKKDELPVIIFDDFTTATQFVDFPFKAKSSAMKILKAKENINIKFVYEAMQNLKFEVGGHGRHWISIYSNLYIDLPSLSEQTKIANFLSTIDKKIELVSNQLQDTQEYKKGLLQQMFV
jgi:type I restriction enzyme S subunit